MSTARAKDPVHVHVLYMDIVDSTRATVDKQDQVNLRLRDLVRSTRAFEDASARNELISLPTGDGMALVFLRKLDGPLECAVEITQALRQDPFCRLRIGIHSGPVIVEDDINGRPNVSGDGISLAARVMSCGGAGHILLTRNAADLVRNLEAWKDRLHKSGTCHVKKDQVEVWNYRDGEIGSSAPLSLHRVEGKLSHKLWIAAVLAIAIAGAAYFGSHRRPRPPIKPAAVEMSLGFNLWRMRPSPPNAEVKERGFVLESDPKGDQEWSAERVSLQGAIREGDRIRFTIQALQPGYLYVINRELYRDGKGSQATLIFPSIHIMRGENHVSPGVPLRIPDPDDRIATFTVKRSRPDQRAILLLLILAPQPLPEIKPRFKDQELPDSLVDDWVRKWGAGVSLTESAAMAGQLFTNADQRAEKAHSPVPASQSMTVFRKKTAQPEPLVATAEIRILDH